MIYRKKNNITYNFGIKDIASVIVLLLIFQAKLHTQEIELTQFDYGLLLLNPANTGNFDGDWRIAGNFRNQNVATTKPFRTAIINFDMPLYILGQKIGVGVFLLNDESGEGGLSFNKFYGSLGYSRSIANNFIGLGLQGGMVYGGFDSWGVWDRNSGTFTAPSGEPSASLKTDYFDFNMGVVYKKSIGFIEPEIGVSVSHINYPKNSFLDDDGEREALKMNAYTFIKTKVTDRIFFTPKILFAGKSNSNFTVAGTDAGYNLLGNTTTLKRIFIGAYAVDGITRELNSISAQIGATISRIDIILNYDIPVSSASQVGKMSAFEITFIYKSISTVLNSYSIPCERY